MDLLKSQDELIRAVNLFSDLTGVTPGQTSFSINMSGRFSTYDAGKAFDEIKKYMKLDASLVTSVMILRAVYEKYIHDTSIPLSHIVEHARTGDLLFRFNRHVQLDELIYRSSLNDLHARAIRRIKKVLKNYGRKGEDLLDDLDRMKDLLLLAAGAEEELKLRQYSTGKDDTEKPTIVEAIVEFESIDEAGGILGLKTPGDKKYGAGVTRRQGEFLEDGSFRVEEEEENFRPDGAPGIKIEESE